MAISWLEGWPFKSKEQQDKEQQEFSARVFPLGEGQREKALAVLRQVASPKLRDSELLFAFISTKDRYVQNDCSPEALEKARVQLNRLRWMKKPDTDMVLALVRLDSLAESLEDYPSADAVRAAAGVS